MLRTISVLAASAFVLPMTAPLLATASGVQPPSFTPIILRDRQLVSDAASVTSALNAVMGVAGSCRAKSIADAFHCGCNATETTVPRLKNAYRQAAEKHPDWTQRNILVSYKNPADGHWISLSMPQVQHMIAECWHR